METLTQSVPPTSMGEDAGVADLESNSRLKASRGLQATGLFMQILAYDMITSTYWLDVRKAQDGQRDFGPAPTALWMGLRKVLPWQQPADDRVGLRRAPQCDRHRAHRNRRVAR